MSYVLFDKIKEFNKRVCNVPYKQVRQKQANKGLIKISDKQFFAVFLFPFNFLIHQSHFQNELPTKYFSSRFLITKRPLRSCQLNSQ